MIFNHFHIDSKKLFLLALAGMLSFPGYSATVEEIREKQIKAAMRMIGHEVLMNSGDCESRIMPIEKINEQYKIPFELEFGFDPYDMVFIIDQVMVERGIANHYLVEVEQSSTEIIVHSYEFGNGTNPYEIPCGGRILPKDSYSLLITILDKFVADRQMPKATNTGLVAPRSKEKMPFNFIFLLISSFLLLGWILYFNKQKKTTTIDPNLILIGTTHFDTRNMTLSFGNKKIALSNKETELLSLLYNAINTPIKRAIILQKVWGDEGDYVGRTLDVFISKLRKKLEADSQIKIVNIRGVGYKLIVSP